MRFTTMQKQNQNARCPNPKLLANDVSGRFGCPRSVATRLHAIVPRQSSRFRRSGGGGINFIRSFVDEVNMGNVFGVLMCLPWQSSCFHVALVYDDT